MKIVTRERLNRALSDVIRDFEHLGIWNDRLYNVGVFLVPIGRAWGWAWRGRGGSIDIPAISLCRLASHVFGLGDHWGLRDILRHEYGHAVADLYPQLVRSRDFKRAFAGSFNCGEPTGKYDPGKHVTGYAASEPAEDFCEVFMFFVKHNGKLPSRFDTPVIRRKWRFVQSFLASIRLG